MEIVLEASHTHLYPGHEGRVAGVSGIAAMPDGAPCRVDFADGSVAFGTLARDGAENWTLEVGPYTTAAGTAMPAKRWRIGLQPAGEGLEFRVRGRLAG